MNDEKGPVARASKRASERASERVSEQGSKQLCKRAGKQPPHQGAEQRSEQSSGCRPNPQTILATDPAIGGETNQPTDRRTEQLLIEFADLVGRAIKEQWVVHSKIRQNTMQPMNKKRLNR